MQFLQELNAGGHRMTNKEALDDIELLIEAAMTGCTQINTRESETVKTVLRETRKYTEFLRQSIEG